MVAIVVCLAPKRDAGKWQPQSIAQNLRIVAKITPAMDKRNGQSQGGFCSFGVDRFISYEKERT